MTVFTRTALIGFGLLSLIATPRASLGQDRIEADLERLTTANAKGFVEPLSRGLAFAMVGGIFDGAEPLGAFDFEVGARVSGALPPRESETFQPVLPEEVVWNGTTYTDPYRARDGLTSTPTVVGRGPGVVLEPSGGFREALTTSGRQPSDFELPLPAGRDIPAVPYPVFHASLGVGFGTELSVRFTPELKVDEELGGFRGLGFALRHALTNWFESPVELSILLARQTLDIGTYLDASSTQYGLLASRRLGPLALFASGQLRSGTVDVLYEVDNADNANPGLPNDGEQIRFSEKLGTGGALGLGARLQLLIMNLSGQYTFEDYSVVTIKVGFGTP